MTITLAIWECRPGGNDNNGGGFATNGTGTDYSQQDAAQYSGTNLTVHASLNARVIPDGHTPTDADLGNIIQITAGTGWSAGWYEITAHDGTYWTLDRTPAATSTAGGTWYMGGAFATPGGASRVFDSVSAINGAAVGHVMWIAAGTYILTNATPATSGGPWQSNYGFGFTVEGYSGTRGTPGIVTLDVGGQTGFITWNHSKANRSTFINLRAVCNDNVSTNGFRAAYAASRFVNCEATGCTGYGFSNCTPINSKALGCNIGFSSGTHAIGCWADDCSIGFNYPPDVSNSLATRCTTFGIGVSTLQIATSCTINDCAIGLQFNGSYGTADGILISSCTTAVAVSGSGSYGNAFALYNNTSDGSPPDDGEHNRIAVVSDPYTNAASDDYTLNAVADGGALCVRSGYLPRYIGAMHPAATSGGDTVSAYNRGRLDALRQSGIIL